VLPKHGSMPGGAPGRTIEPGQAQSTRRVHGVFRHVLANGSASFQSHPNHANTFRPNTVDSAIPPAKDLRAETGTFGAFKPNVFTCANIFLISRSRERVWKGMCHLRVLALAGMIGREGSSRLNHSDQEMGDPSVLERSLRRQLRHPPCSDAPPLAPISVEFTICTICHKFWAQCVRACREERRRHITCFLAELGSHWCRITFTSLAV